MINALNANTPAPLPAPGPSPRAVAALDATLGLDPNGGAPLRAIGRLRPEEQADFAQMLAKLLQQGVVGAETREVDGRAYTTFVDAGIAAPPWLRDAPPYRTLDLRA